MSELKCPFCQQELRKIHPTYVICDNCRITGEDKLWQELIRTKELLEIESTEHEMCHTQMLKTTEKLERTRKALEITVDALKEIDETRSVANHKIGTQNKTLNSGIIFCWTTPDEIHNALEQITALEQKD